MKVKPDPTKTLSVPEAGRIYFNLGMNGQATKPRIAGKSRPSRTAVDIVPWSRRSNGCLIKPARQSPPPKTQKSPRLIDGASAFPTGGRSSLAIKSSPPPISAQAARGLPMTEPKPGAHIHHWQIIAVDGRRCVARCRCHAIRTIATEDLLSGI